MPRAILGSTAHSRKRLFKIRQLGSAERDNPAHGRASRFVGGLCQCDRHCRCVVGPGSHQHMAAVRIALSILHQQGQFLKSRHFAVRPVALPGWGIRNLQHPDQFKSSRDQPEQQDSVDRDDQGKSDLLIDGHGDSPELCGRLVTRSTAAWRASVRGQSGDRR